MLRLALSGGDRHDDGTTDLTILQRAVLPDTALTCALNSLQLPGQTAVARRRRDGQLLGRRACGHAHRGGQQ